MFRLAPLKTNINKEDFSYMVTKKDYLSPSIETVTWMSKDVLTGSADTMVYDSDNVVNWGVNW